MLNNKKYKKYADDVIELMYRSLSYDSASVRNLIKSVAIGNGKMIRSLILFIFANLESTIDEKKYEKCIKFGAVIELIHLATLIHDDVIDKADKRRGSPSLNSNYDNRIAILSGDLIFSTSFRLMTSEENSSNILRIISHACEDLVCGEIEEDIFLENKNILKVDYLSVITKKTARLFEASAQSGAYINSSSKVKYASEFGRNLGIAFQIIDDTIDYFGNEKETGKALFSDIKSKKYTLPLILLNEVSSVDEKDYINNIFSDSENKIEESNILKIVEIMKNKGINDTLYLEAKKYTDLAKESLNHFKHSEERDLLMKLIDNLLVVNK